MHPPQRARHGGCRRRGPCLQQWPQRHDNDRLAAAIDLCVDPCGWRRRRSSSACTAAETPRKRSWHLPGMWGNALRQWEGRGGARLAVVRKFGPDHGAEASGRKARLWVEGRLQGGSRTSRVAKEVSEVAKTMGKSNAVEEITCKGLQKLLPCSHRVGDEPRAAGRLRSASESERPAKQVSERVRTPDAPGRCAHAKIR